MQRPIQPLSEETIQQIAAGQVVQSPACVVKELVENSLDAGATQITIDVIGGGLKKIVVIDNGFGMDRENLLLSVKKHTTSKLSTISDLECLFTMGFRGEALASIGAISRMTLSSAIEGEMGSELVIEGGVVQKIRSCGRRQGTTVEIESLFYNVPARKKFQKSGAILAGQLFRLITTLALSRPDVSFELISNGKKVLSTTKKETLSLRVQEVLSSFMVEEAVPIECKKEEIEVRGILGHPAMAKLNKTGQYLFVNGRAVHSSLIEEAVSAGYATSLEPRRYPCFVLHLNLPPSRVDINVDPQKKEIRFEGEAELSNLLSQMIAEALSFSIPHRPVNSFVLPVSSLEEKESFAEFRPSLPFVSLAQEEELPMSLAILENSCLGEFEIIHIQGPYAFVREGGKEELLLFDLRLVRSYLFYEKLIQEKTTPLERQRLLLPFELKMTKIEITLLLTHQNAVEELGFSFRFVKEEILHLDALPSFIKEKEVERVFCDIAAFLQEGVGKPIPLEIKKKTFAKVAASSALHETTFSYEEAKTMLETLKMFAKERSFFELRAPQGSLLVISLEKKHFENFFDL